jgi:hypothetical protein
VLQWPLMSKVYVHFDLEVEFGIPFTPCVLFCIRT